MLLCGLHASCARPLYLLRLRYVTCYMLYLQEGQKGVEQEYKQSQEFHDLWKEKARDLLARAEFRKRKITQRVHLTCLGHTNAAAAAFSVLVEDLAANICLTNWCFIACAEGCLPHSCELHCHTFATCAMLICCCMVRQATGTLQGM